MIEKICLIILANLGFYAKTICYKYSSDDIPIIQSPPLMRNKWERFIFWLDGRRRSHQGKNPQADHFLTILIHTATCVFIFLGFGKDNISFFAALLFAVNPTGNQGSVWISGRSYALAALGMTGAKAFPILSGTFILLATYTNAGFIAPLALLGSKSISYYWLTIPACWAINWKRFRGNVKNKWDMETLEEDKAIKPEKIVLLMKTFGFYTLLSLVPFKNAFYHSFNQSASGAGRFKAYDMRCRFFWIGVLMAIGIVCFWFMTPWSMASLGLLWWCLCIAPFSNFIRMSQEMAERYCYLPMVGLMVALASVLVHYPVIMGVVLSMYATRMWFLMDMYQDDYYLLEHACLQDPCSWFVWHVRGVKRWDNKSFQEAVIIWTMARRLSPKEFKINFNLATVLASNNNKAEAEHYLKVAQDNIPPGQEERSKDLIARWRKGDMAIII